MPEPVSSRWHYAALCRCPKDCPAEVADLIWACLSPDPAARPSSQQVVRALVAHVEYAGEACAAEAAALLGSDAGGGGS